MSEFEFCKVEREGRLTIVTMNRPDVMNALHPPANFELAKIFDQFAQDADQWVAIITGAGDRAFSAGNDLKYQAAGNPITVPPTGFAGLTSRFDLNKPVIAAVNGLAMGGGFEIALACDLIVAAETALFALPEPRVGLAALAGGLHRLPREIGMKKALGMILTGRRVTRRRRPDARLRERSRKARRSSGGREKTRGPNSRMFADVDPRLQGSRLPRPRGILAASRDREPKQIRSDPRDVSQRRPHRGPDVVRPKAAAAMEGALRLRRPSEKMP